MRFVLSSEAIGQKFRLLCRPRWTLNPAAIRVAVIKATLRDVRGRRAGQIPLDCLLVKGYSVDTNGDQKVTVPMVSPSKSPISSAIPKR
jgi:hypothetical protein